ncbi:MAG: hypothetical protein JHC95_08865 [Solirubrobacteraceae bacterium]|nr:hypothetical protein [Solirubrobacteraceae bacterium]
MGTLAEKHGTSAFAREDIEDARRRRPAVELHDYAAARNLEFHGRQQLAGFRMALPHFREEMHNAMRGVLPGGRFGVLLHQVIRTHGPESPAIQGTFHAVRPSSPEPFWKSLVPDRTDIPIIGNFLDPPTDDTPRVAFDQAGAWAPTTTAATAVPETAAPLPRCVFLQTGRTARFAGKDVRDLAELGAPGWRAHPLASTSVDEGVLERLMARPGRGVLDALRVPWAEVRVDHGMLTVRRNGYVTDPAELDGFAQLTCRMADALRDACLAGVPPEPAWPEPLPRCPWEIDDAAVTEPSVAAGWSADFRDYAQRHGLTLEDPDAWRRLHPSLPVPGRVLAVARAAQGMRVLFTTDVPLVATRAVRGAIAYAVPEGTPDTPPGGFRPMGLSTTVSVTGGVAIAWTHRLHGYTREADDLVPACVAAAHAAGIPVPAA